MCGINGFNFKNEELLSAMNQLTKHRGPDGTGVFIDEFVSLGHNLLAITEIPENSQGPYISQDKNFVISYNGEIYNYKALRDELKNLGENFTTIGDTEVLLKGLARHGIDFIKKLDGMFAIAFYDKQVGKLYLARDRAGMKPLYYHFENGRIIFSSEIRPILTSVEARLNHKATQAYFVLGYVPGEETMFRGINRVMPGHFLTIDLKTKQLSDTIYGFEKDRFTEGVNFNNEDFRKMMGESVLNHTMGLRPFGLYLSGGLDSTIILHELALHSKDLIRTYTTRFESKDSKFNEDADLAKRLCNDYNIEHHEILITQKDFIDAFDKTIETLEEPRYHISVPSYYLLAQRASQDITVALSGNGGDELFGGYDKYLDSQKLTERYARYPAFLLNFGYTIKNLRRGKLRLGHLMTLDKTLVKWSHLNKIMSIIGGPEFNLPSFDIVDLANYLASSAKSIMRNPLSDKENSLAELDRLFWLADEDLMRSDRIMMHFGMEGRFPFLANDIIKYANSIPAKDKIKRGATKALVREAYRGKLPDYIIDKKKSGWYAPTVEWLHSDFGKKIREMLEKDFYPETASLFDLDYIRKTHFDSGREFDRVSIKKFIPIAIFQAWAKRFNVRL